MPLKASPMQQPRHTHLYWPTGVAAAVLGAVLSLATVHNAHAQVTRCTDPATGKVTYTDGGCARGTSATEIERRKSDEELAQDRAREREALRNKAERREQEYEQRKLEADERAALNATQRNNRSLNRPDYANSAACQQSREQYSAASDAASNRISGGRAQLDAAKHQMELDCMGPEAYSRLEASRPAPTTVINDDYWDRYPYGRPHPPVRPLPQPLPQQPAPSITRCNVFNCVDSQGYTHPRGQIGETPRPVQPANPRSCRSQGGSAPC